MSDIKHRLRGSLRFDAINGNSHERAICARQMGEAADYIGRLEAQLEELRRERDATIKRVVAAGDAIVIGEYNEAYHQLYELLREMGFADLPDGTFESAREALLYGKALRKSSTESDWRLASCTWTQDEDDGFWYTECGNAYEFMEDGPEENNHKFCPYCGGHLAALLTRPNG